MASLVDYALSAWVYEIFQSNLERKCIFILYWSFVGNTGILDN